MVRFASQWLIELENITRGGKINVIISPAIIQSRLKLKRADAIKTTRILSWNEGIMPKKTPNDAESASFHALSVENILLTNK
jgi:hypothetical protein